MQEFSKYKVITVGIILMFVFVIAAIYTNTKDIANQKMQDRQEIGGNSGIERKNTINTSSDITQNINNSMETTNSEITLLKERIMQLEQKIYNEDNKNNEKEVKCSVKGIIDDGHIVPLDPEDAVNESRTNNKEVLITCIFK